MSVKYIFDHIKMKDRQKESAARFVNSGFGSVISQVT